MPERKLATLEQIRAIEAIPDADAIEVATVRDWQVVVRKGDFNRGDTVVYFEVDSLLPTDDERFAFLALRGTKTIDGRAFHVLRTAKLRGQISQGLILGAYAFPEVPDSTVFGSDLTDALGIAKWEPPIPAELAGRTLGAFPANLLPKTDAERVQNLGEVFEQLIADPDDWQATEKVDGTSVSYINVDGTPRLCSRNWELVWNPDLTQIKVALRDDLVPDPGWAIQAELYGEGVQGNPLGIKGQRLAVFNVLFRKHQRFEPVPRADWPDRFRRHAAAILDLELPGSIGAAIEQVDGMKSQINPARLAEGVVWHHRSGKTFSELGGRECFKAVSNRYLLKHGG